MPLDRSVGKYFDSSNTHLRRVGRWRGPSSYVTGGDPAPPALFGLSKIFAAHFAPVVDGTAYRNVVWNPLTEKVYFSAAGSGSEVAAGSDLSAFVSMFEIIGQ